MKRFPFSGEKCKPDSDNGWCLCPTSMPHEHSLGKERIIHIMNITDKIKLHLKEALGAFIGIIAAVLLGYAFSWHDSFGDYLRYTSEGRIIVLIIVGGVVGGSGGNLIGKLSHKLDKEEQEDKEDKE